MFVKTFGSAVYGVEAITITIEVNWTSQGKEYCIVGLPDSAIKESSYRIAAALKNNGYSLPVKKIIINMAPADLRKEGSAYDLGVLKKFEDAINKLGWYSEWYDAGTMNIWPI